ncbi:MAG: CAP domain-containing protein [Myxococcota bacterium]
MRTTRTLGGAVLCWMLIAMPACEDGTAVPDCNDAQDDETCAVFRLVNEARIDADLPPYAWDVDLAVSAQRHAQDMVDNAYFDHASLDGRSFSDRAKEAGYDAFPSGENIARGQQDAPAVMDSWMNSPGHRANILSEGSNEIGVGLVDTTWVQVFGARTE